MSELVLALMVSTASAAAVEEPPIPPRITEPASVPAPPRANKPNPATATASGEASVVIAEGGNFGMAFRFGGLASLSTDGNVRVLAQSFPVTQVGLKYVFSRNLHLPFFFGIGVRSVDDGPGDAATLFGLDFGIGVEWHFRIWERISPFFGLTFSVGVLNPGDDEDLRAGAGLGPQLGIEYFIADRVSLSAQYGLGFSSSAPSPMRPSSILVHSPMARRR